MADIDDIIKGYEDGSIQGFTSVESDETRFRSLQDNGSLRLHRSLDVTPKTPLKQRYSQNWKIVRAVLHGDVNNINQETGDCTSWGVRNALCITGCNDIWIRKENETWKDPFPPFIYGVTRVQIENDGRPNRSGAGADPVASGVAVHKYGTVYFDDPGVPKYSGTIADSWGRNGPPAELFNISKQRLVQSVIQIKTYEDALWYACNGYGMFIGADFGYTYKPDAQGFHQRGANWSHQMCIWDIDDEWSDPFVLIMNSWGDSFGHLKDFRTGDPLPLGVIRVRKALFLKHLAAGTVYALCQYDQPKAQVIPAVPEELYRLY